MDFLNSTSAYLEFEPLDGERSIVQKSSIKSARAIAPPKAPSLSQRLRDLDGFDPYQILRLERGCGWEDVRTAYHSLAKVYHADRYATSELPNEVTTYLENMSRRVNAAYATLETTYAQSRRYAKHRQEPIFTTPVR
jgi:DnaJ-domain-containing protein 1